jgi:hypothetical protein
MPRKIAVPAWHFSRANLYYIKNYPSILLCQLSILTKDFYSIFQNARLPSQLSISAEHFSHYIYECLARLLYQLSFTVNHCFPVYIVMPFILGQCSLLLYHIDFPGLNPGTNWRALLFYVMTSTRLWKLRGRQNRENVFSRCLCGCTYVACVRFLLISCARNSMLLPRFTKSWPRVT